MSQFIIFDGDFHEVEVLWLKEWKEDEDWDQWLPRNGFRAQDLWGVYEEGIDTLPRAISVYRHEKEPRWLVSVTSGGDIFDFVIEGRVNYLKFLSSPLCTTIDLQEDFRVFRATTERAFAAWHGHRAPEGLEDHGLGTSCSTCDPGFEENRREDREQLRRRTADRRERGAKRERGRQWVAEQRAELERKDDD